MVLCLMRVIVGVDIIGILYDSYSESLESEIEMRGSGDPRDDNDTVEVGVGGVSGDDGGVFNSGESEVKEIMIQEMGSSYQ
jgi:hypothetical protein